MGEASSRPMPSFYLFLLGREQLVEQPADETIHIRLSDGPPLARSLGSPRHNEMAPRTFRSKPAWTRQ